MPKTTRMNMQIRTITFDIEAREADGGIPVTVSTNAVVDVADGPEILVHEHEAIDLSRAPLPIIATHRGGQINVGIVHRLLVSDGRMRGVALFGARAEAVEYKNDILTGIIRSVSAGYMRLKGHIRKDGVLITTHWMPSHVAMVAEPADINTGFFRSLTSIPPFELSEDPATTKERTSITVPADATVGIGRQESDYEVRMIRASSPAPRAATREASMEEGRLKETGSAAVMDQPEELGKGLAEMRAKNGLEVESGRRRAIDNFAKANRIADSVREAWIEQGYSLEEVSKDLLNILEERGRTDPQPVSRLGLSHGETERFSMLRAIRACADKSWQKTAPFELEVTRALAQKMGKVADETRFCVPFEVMERKYSVRAIEALRQELGFARRDLTVATAGAGGFLVQTDNVGFIDMLRNRSVAFRMGVRRLSGLVGSVTIPRQSAAATAVWLANEASTITESQQTFVQVALTPKNVGAYTEISRQLLLQSVPGAEGIVTGDLAAVVATAADLAVLNGSGASGQPLGIIGTAGIGGVTGTSLAYAGILEFQTDVAGSNVMPAAGGYVTTPAVASLMLQRVKFASTASPLWEGNVWDGMMSGFPAMSSNQVPAANMLFGDWSEVVVAEWGVLEIEVNPYANFQSGIIGVRSIYSMDVGVKRPFAFSLATSIT